MTSYLPCFGIGRGQIQNTPSKNLNHGRQMSPAISSFHPLRRRTGAATGGRVAMGITVSAMGAWSWPEMSRVTISEHLVALCSHVKTKLINPDVFFLNWDYLGVSQSEHQKNNIWVMGLHENMVITLNLLVNHNIPHSMVIHTHSDHFVG